MTALGVVASLILVAVFAVIAAAGTGFLEDIHLLTINKYFAMIASWIFWQLCAAAGFLIFITSRLGQGGTVTATPGDFNWWAYIASSIVYFLVFHIVLKNLN
jgi:hypothetical protein